MYLGAASSIFHALCAVSTLSLHVIIVSAGETGTFASEESEASVLSKVKDLNIDSLTAEDVDVLVQRGWHEAVTAIVAQGHKGSEEQSQRVASHVREAVKNARNRLDDLVRVLDRNYGKAVEVKPAAQWAQNSTHVFLQVKFAQRWNAPGVLEVSNETMEFSSCCMNFTAYGEHSFIMRKYDLSFHFLQPIIPSASSWHFAAAGRMTITVAKAKPANWAAMVHESTVAPKNLGRWRDMQERWKSDLEKFVPSGSPDVFKKKKPEEDSSSSKKSKKKAKGASKAREESEENEDAMEKELDLLSECTKGAFAGSSVQELCEKAWQVVKKPELPRKWLMTFYAGDGVGEQKTMQGLMPVLKRLAEVLPSTERTGRVGAVDCSLEKVLCKELGVHTKLPQVRRFLDGGEGEALRGELSAVSLESLMAFVAGRDEL